GRPAYPLDAWLERDAERLRPGRVGPGHVEIDQVPVGTWPLHHTAPGRVPITLNDPAVREGAVTTARANLTRGTTLRATISLPPGVPRKRRSLVFRRVETAGGAVSDRAAQ